MSHLFENIDPALAKVKEIAQFQKECNVRYTKHLEKELENYRNAVNELIQHNPSLYNYFAERVKVPKDLSTQQRYQSIRNQSVSTMKPVEHYQVHEASRRSLSEIPDSSREEIPGFRKIGKKNNRYNSGNGVFNVPSTNLNTAYKTSERARKSPKVDIDRKKEWEIKNRMRK